MLAEASAIKTTELQGKRRGVHGSFLVCSHRFVSPQRSQRLMPALLPYQTHECWIIPVQRNQNSIVPPYHWWKLPCHPNKPSTFLKSFRSGQSPDQYILFVASLRLDKAWDVVDPISCTGIELVPLLFGIVRKNMRKPFHVCVILTLYFWMCSKDEFRPDTVPKMTTYDWPNAFLRH